MEADAYAMELLRYVHLNPVRPRNKSAPVRQERRDALRQYRWSSHRFYLGLLPSPAWFCLDWLSFFGRSRKAGHREYERFVNDAFGGGIESPWTNLRSGLLLGSDALMERVRGLIEKKSGFEEVAWTARTDDGGRRESAAQTLASRQADRRWKAWVLARLGGERGVDIARGFGYKDGSTITHMLKRLKSDIQNNPALGRQEATLNHEFECLLSSFKR